MQARRSHSPSLRRVAFTAALAALILPVGQAEAKKTPKKPVVTSVKPMQANIGDTITIYGRNFIKGKAKNTIAFRRDGAKTVFVKGDVSTLRQIRVTLPATLAPFVVDGKLTRFRIRVLARRFGKSFTPVSKSPRIGPAIPKANDATAPGETGAPGTPAQPVAPPDCDKDGIHNGDELDDDNDLLADTLEAKLMTDPCSADSDGDGAEDGFEYKSAIDLNDDEYQQPNKALPYPGGKPYPNPLYAEKPETDFDNDQLPLITEFELWKYTHSVSKTSARTLFPLTYSDGMQYSVHEVCKASGNPLDSPCAAIPNSEGRRYPTLKVENYDRWFGPGGFYTWLNSGSGYARVVLGWYPDEPPFFAGAEYDLLDVNLSDTLTDWGYTTTGVKDYPNTEGDEYPRSELYAFAADRGLYMSDEERDEDADGLSNIDELRGRVTYGYWTKCYTKETPFPLEDGQKENPLSPFDEDSDDDGVRDGADDIDHDDVPNIMEISRIAASGYDDTENGKVTPKDDKGVPIGPPDVGIAGPDFNSCTLDKELPPAGTEEEPIAPWHSGEWGRVNPFNPCLPFPQSRTCPRYRQFGEGAPTPLNEDEPNKQWFALQ